MARRKLNPRQLETLAQVGHSWTAVPGADGSHHSGTLAQLGRGGYVERWKDCEHAPGRRRDLELLRRNHANPWPWCSCKAACRYRLSAKGARVVATAAATAVALAPTGIAAELAADDLAYQCPGSDGEDEPCDCDDNPDERTGT